MGEEKKVEILVTEETRAVVEHYLQKQYARREKRLAKKEEKKKITGTWDPGKGTFGG
jgi:hypothetical protein